MTMDFSIDLRKRMTGTLESLKKDFNSLRTGRASTALLDNVMVDMKVIYHVYDPTTNKRRYRFRGNDKT